MSQHKCVSHVSQCINAHLMSMQSTTRYPSKTPLSCPFVRFAIGASDGIPCTKTSDELIYGVESGATVPKTASSIACSNATVGSNSSTSVIADRKI